MERKVFLSQYLIWLMLLEQLHGYKSCIQKERNALKEYLISIKSEGWSLDSVLPTWKNDLKSDCCSGWEEIKCNRTSGRVIEISIHMPYLKKVLSSISLCCIPLKMFEVCAYHSEREDSVAYLIMLKVIKA